MAHGGREWGSRRRDRIAGAVQDRGRAKHAYQLGHLGPRPLDLVASHGPRPQRQVSGGHSALQAEGDLVRFGALQQAEGVLVLEVLKEHAGAQELVPCRRGGGGQGMGICQLRRGLVPPTSLALVQ